MSKGRCSGGYEIFSMLMPQYAKESSKSSTKSFLSNIIDQNFLHLLKGDHCKPLRGAVIIHGRKLKRHYSEKNW